ncbi:MAG: glycosyltransferase [Candidatus Micrarchaeaceae archaeon]
MYGLYTDVYVAFLGVVAALMLANVLVPRKRKRIGPSREFRPKVLVVVPCKGHDIDLEGNLNTAKAQRYGNYSVIAVVASKDDVAMRAIRKSGIRYMVSDPRYRGSAKVKSVATAISRHRDYDAYVILDSDARIRSDWLRLLVAPLADKDVGLSTAFQVFVPIGGFWSKVKHAWGFSGQGLMENSMTRFGWGGSLAFRRDLLLGDDFKYFSNSISDDIALTRISKSRGLRIEYVEEANPEVKTDDSFSSFAEWSNRQTALSIAGSRGLLYLGFAFYFMELLILVSSLLLALLHGLLFLALLAPLVAGALKLYERSGRAYAAALYFMLIFVYLLNLIAASRMDAIEWRGRRYSLTEIKNDTSRSAKR